MSIRSVAKNGASGGKLTVFPVTTTASGENPAQMPRVAPETAKGNFKKNGRPE